MNERLPVRVFGKHYNICRAAALEFGVFSSWLSYRLNVAGWSIEKALTTPEKKIDEQVVEGKWLEF